MLLRPSSANYKRLRYLSGMDDAAASALAFNGSINARDPLVLAPALEGLRCGRRLPPPEG